MHTEKNRNTFKFDIIANENIHPSCCIFMHSDQYFIKFLILKHLESPEFPEKYDPGYYPTIFQPMSICFIPKLGSNILVAKFNGRI